MAVIGSRGDVQPLIALGVALRERGHDVHLAAFAEFAGLAREAGIAFHPIPGSAQHFFSSPEVVEALRKGTSVWGLLRKTSRNETDAAVQMLEMYETYFAEAFSGADLVVSAMTNRSNYLAAPPQVPWAVVSWYPAAPTSTFPSPGWLDLPLGPWYRRLSHHITEFIEWRLIRRGVNTYRAKHGDAPLGVLPPLASIERARPTFYLQSPSVWPTGKEWPSRVHMSGYWFWDREWEPSREVRDAVEGDRAPVVLSFGSLWPAVPDGSLELVADAVRAADRRLIVIDGPEDVPSDVLRLRDADYTWLFPRAAAVVHHGGFGTGAAALRAGVPQVVCPIFVDHPLWAKRMARLGVAPKPVPTASLTAGKIRRAVHQALTDPRMPARAAELAERVRADNGLEHACEELESWARSGEPVPAD